MCFDVTYVIRLVIEINKRHCYFFQAQKHELSCCYKEHKEQRQELRTLQDTLSIQQNICGNIHSDL